MWGAIVIVVGLLFFMLGVLSYMEYEITFVPVAKREVYWMFGGVFTMIMGGGMLMMN